MSNATWQWSKSAIQLSKNQDIYIQSNTLATWQAIMLAFVPISLAWKGNTKCQAKYSSNNRIITAAPGTAGGQAWSPTPKQNNNIDQWLSWWGGSTQETRYEHYRNMLTVLHIEPWLCVSVMSWICCFFSKCLFQYMLWKSALNVIFSHRTEGNVDVNDIYAIIIS